MTGIPIAWVPVSSWESLGQAFCCVSPGRGVCACVTHPEVWGDTGQGQVLQDFEH